MIKERYEILAIKDNTITIEIPKKFNDLNTLYKAKFVDNNKTQYSVIGYHLGDNIIHIKNYSYSLLNKTKWITLYD